jgi:hypothetical protein
MNCMKKRMAHNIRYFTALLPMGVSIATYRLALPNCCLKGTPG